jgi:excisionase family DNA binding protein
MNLTDRRLDPSLLDAEERKNLESLVRLTRTENAVVLKGSDGTEVPLPAPVFKLLTEVVTELQHGGAMMLMPLEEAFSTQAAADYLGYSRQFVVNLLEEGKIPFHRVGSHRRIVFKDLLEFANRRDKERREGLDKLFDRIREEGFYNFDYQGENP